MNLLTSLLTRGSPLATGLLVAAAGAAAAFALSSVFEGISALLVAITLGALVGNVRLLSGLLHSNAVEPGMTFASKTLLRVGVVVLGFRLSLDDILGLGWPTLAVVIACSVLTFFGAVFIGRRMRLTEPQSILIGSGFAICGLSAVAAVNSVVQADESETAYAMGLVTLAGTTSLFLLPALGHLLDLDPVLFGKWVGAAVNDVGQTVATASTLGDAALETAVVVKLVRVALLAPLVAGLAWARASRTSERSRSNTIVPLFIVGFLVAVLLTSTGVLPSSLLETIRMAEGAFFAIALFAIGARVSVARLRRLGGKPAVVGGIVWLVVAASSLLGMSWVS